MSRLFPSLLAAAAVIALATPAMAADNGVGATSEGSSSLEITIPAQVHITGVADAITVEASDLANLGVDHTETDDVCVFSNAGANRGYVVKAGTVSGATGDFELVASGEPGIEALPFSVAFTAGTDTNVPLTNTNSTTVFTGGGEIGSSCTAGAENASFTITFTAANLQKAQAATYSGTLYLVVSPDPAEV